MADNHLQFDMTIDTPGVQLTPAFAAIYKERMDQQGKDRPSGKCLPHSIPDAMLAPTPFKFIHAPGVTLILYEEFVDFRQVFMDGRPLPKDPEPAWFGYSVGKWDGGVFVIDTRGFNDKSWLDDDGHPHSDALHTVERFRRPDFGHLTMEITFDDPKAYVKPWNATVDLELLPDNGADRIRVRKQLRSRSTWWANKPTDCGATLLAGTLFPAAGSRATGLTFSRIHLPAGKVLQAG